MSEDEYMEVRKRSKSPEKELRKSYSAEIINHPSLPRVPRYEVNMTNERFEKIPPLPAFETPKMSPTSELTLQNVTKFNKTSSSPRSLYRDTPSTSTFDPVSLFNQRSHHIREILPSTKNLPDIDQTIGIPVAFDSIDNPLIPYYASAKDNDFQPSTTIHTYPLISGTIPSMGSQMKSNVSTVPLPSTLGTSKKDAIPTSSILSNSNNINATNSNSNANKKEGAEKNKVKFSDTIQVAVVPEISRKEKIVNFNERVIKRKVYPPGYDPIRRELAESLPLCHPNDEYLKDFLPAAERKEFNNGSSSKQDDKKKPSIKVVNFGVL